MNYELELRKNGKGKLIKGKNAQEISAALDQLSIVKTGRYFEACGHRFLIIGREKHGSYMKVTFLKVRGN